MSAYALPGSFSFPISTNSICHDNTPSPTKCGEMTSDSTITSTTNNNKLNIPSVSSNNNGLCVKIPFASFDPIRFVQSLTNCRNSKSSSNTNSTKWNKPTPETVDEIVEEEEEEEVEDEEETYLPHDTHHHHHDNDENDFYDYSETFVSCRQNVNQTDCSTPNLKDNQQQQQQNEQDAIHFHLSINFYGRTYTAKRTLPSFIKLRNDLIQELSYTSSIHTMAKKRNSKSSSSSSSYDYHQDSSSNDTSWLEKSNKPTLSQQVIPELPLEDGNHNHHHPSSTNKYYNRTSFQKMAGFSRLHAACASYCPAFESWLRHVADLVPGSPTLCKFLWEPLKVACTSSSSSSTTTTTTTKTTTTTHNSINQNEKTHKKKSRRPSTTLCPIDETNTEEEDNDHDNDENEKRM